MNILVIDAIVCPVAALYFLYPSPAETVEQQNQNNKYSGIFITISLFCSTIKQSSKKVTSLRNKLVKCCLGKSIKDGDEEEKSDRESGED